MSTQAMLKALRDAGYSDADAKLVVYAIEQDDATEDKFRMTRYLTDQGFQRESARQALRLARDARRGTYSSGGGGGGGDSSGGSTTPPGGNWLAHTQLLLPWLPLPLAQVYADAWAETGDPMLATAMMRQSNIYDQWLPGNRRDDGSFRLDEAAYFATRDSYNRTLAVNGINPAIFDSMYPSLIEGEVSAREFADRVNAARTQIIDNLPTVRAYYAQNFGSEFTDEAIFASFLNPEIGDAILNRRISMSQIGGAAALRGFDLGLSTAGRLAASGLNQSSAQEFFARAARNVPVISRLTGRFNEGAFDLNSMIEGDIFGDPDEINRIRRVLESEAASFTSETSAYRRGWAVTGLRAR